MTVDPLAAPGRRIRAAVLDGPGQPVRVTEVELAQAGAGEAEVPVAAAGVCHSDLHIVLGDWPHPVPLVLGHEGSGVVAALRALVPEGLDYVFDAIGKIEATEQAIAALGLGGSAVLVGLPPSGQQARFDPLALAEAAEALADLRSGRTLRQLLVWTPAEMQDRR
jgi:Zn-dependent alcohol dehydrogenase